MRAFTLSWWCLVALPQVAHAGENLPYEPWRDSEPLTGPTPVPAPGPAPLPVSEEYARRTYELGASTALRALSCASGSRDCAARSLAGAARYRPSPFVAWALNVESTRFASTRETYLGTGIRVYPSRAGSTDPFAELGLGGDFRGRPSDVVIASQLSFGVSTAFGEHVKLSSVLTLHQRGRSCHGCRVEVPWAKRWVTVGLGLEVWLGEKH